MFGVKLPVSGNIIIDDRTVKGGPNSNGCTVIYRRNIEFEGAQVRFGHRCNSATMDAGNSSHAIFTHHGAFHHPFFHVQIVLIAKDIHF